MNSNFSALASLRPGLTPQEYLQLDRTWNWIRTQKAEWFSGDESWWYNLEEKILAHVHHPVVAQCRGCKREYCEHTKESICQSHPVCWYCDHSLQPNPYNPKNSDLVAYYKVELP